ncbi:hypothetical protein BJ508DRAFT_327461 [Ascobolus immersus RN42]|uniref:Uncharacterized protein n=1 Tax=Ascobolus immersus RN42 TaxID=1160509 RepID=A0A3N4I2N1_ASCIM|nr:hypothetical protein BJ508DRAFT_327461 [Ascobolus immersus RN42]
MARLPKSPRPPPKTPRAPNLKMSVLSLKETPTKQSQDDQHHDSSLSIASKTNYSTTHNVVGGYRLHEINGTMFDGVDPFVEALYPEIPDSLCRKVMKDCGYDKKVRRWRLDDYSQGCVSDWLEEVQKAFKKAKPAMESRMVVHADYMIRGGKEKRAPDLIFLDSQSEFTERRIPQNKKTDAAFPNVDWKHLRAFAELKKNVKEIGIKKTNFSLAQTMMERARIIFQHQHFRRHLHCFAIGHH